MVPGENRTLKDRVLRLENQYELMYKLISNVQLRIAVLESDEPPYVTRVKFQWPIKIERVRRNHV